MKLGLLTARGYVEFSYVYWDGINKTYIVGTRRNGKSKAVRLSHEVYRAHTGRRVPRGRLLHHIDENPRRNCFTNLELTTRAKHASHHHKGRIVSEKTRARMRLGAQRRVADPAHREHLRQRALGQYAKDPYWNHRSRK